jgi:hypothetical protein
MNPLFPSKILISTGPKFKDAGCSETVDVEVDLIPSGEAISQEMGPEKTLLLTIARLLWHPVKRCTTQPSGRATVESGRQIVQYQGIEYAVYYEQHRLQLQNSRLSMGPEEGHPVSMS